MSDNELIAIPQAHDTDKLKPRRATLDDLKRKNVTVILQVGEEDSGEREEDGTPIMRPVEVEIPLRTISYFRAQEINTSVKDPGPPDGDIVRDEKTGNIRKTFNYNDPTYLAAVQMAHYERSYRLIMEAWRQDDFPLPGATYDERLQYLKEEFDVAVVRQLVDILTGLGMKGQARIQARAETFHNGRTGNAASNGTAGHQDEGAVG